MIVILFFMWELKSGCEDETTILSQPWSFSLSAIAKNQGLVFCNPYPRMFYADFSLHVRDIFPSLGPWSAGRRVSGQILVTDHWSLPVRPLSNQRLDREVPSWEFLSGWSGHLPSESPSFLMILGVLFRICRHFEVLTDWRMDMKKRLLDIKARSSLSS